MKIMNIQRLPYSTRFSVADMVSAFRLERGVVLGIDDAMFARHLLESSGLSSLWAVDPYKLQYRTYRISSARIELSHFGDRARMLHMTSAAACQIARDENQTFDFAYVDIGSIDLLHEWMPLMNRPALIGGYHLTRRFKRNVKVRANHRNELRSAATFAASYNMPIYITGEHWCTWLAILNK